MASSGAVLSIKGGGGGGGSDSSVWTGSGAETAVVGPATTRRAVAQDVAVAEEEAEGAEKAAKLAEPDELARN